MDAAALLSEYARRHDAAVTEGRAERLAELFGTEGELVFHGVAVPVTRGQAAIERLFRERGPDGLLVLHEIVPGPPGVVRAAYGWKEQPGRIGGTLRLSARDGRIERLDVVVLRGGPLVPRPRTAARALMVTPDDRVLLLPCTEPATLATWWITPGGGVEPGETPTQAVRREMVEETGYDAGPSPGPLVWVREHVFTWGHNAVRQQEHYFWVRRDAFPAGEGRGWTVAEIRATAADLFVPLRFPDLLETLLRDGPPAQPIDVSR